MNMIEWIDQEPTGLRISSNKDWDWGKRKGILTKKKKAIILRIKLEEL